MVFVDHCLDGREQESNRLSSTSLCLCEAVDSIRKKIVESSSLNRHHMVELEVLSDRLDEKRM